MASVVLERSPVVDFAPLSGSLISSTAKCSWKRVAVFAQVL